ncbi:MAG: hypothetical protein M1814_004907 [Vezdaea aestivalis]|nr:MAG: hypothetical protein M1814_004907 [Vezdaea aestivalis]
MPTPIDRALNSRNAFLGFAGIVTAAAAWSIWGSDMFPASPAPPPTTSSTRKGKTSVEETESEKNKGKKPETRHWSEVQHPETWSDEELRSWLGEKGVVVEDGLGREELVRRAREEIKRRS